MSRIIPSLSFVALSVLIGTTAVAQTGVSDDRVSLPEGPGSLEGVGENVGINTNMGSMSYSVPIVAPAGFGAVTPKLSLSYSSSGGESVVGVGWSIPMPSIERMTYRKLPQYTPDDDICANGSEQLVRLPGTNPPVYRSRFEGGFVRTTWMEQGDGSEGYWLAEYPDGSKGYFGATQDGTLVPEARVGDPQLGTFKYMMVEKVDVYGHRMVYTYQKFGHYSLPTSIGYVFVDDAPTYEVRFHYEERSDADDQAFISSADGGFDLLLTQRLARVDVFSRGQRIRAYQLGYEPYASSGGFTRLTRVETLGARGGVYPVIFEFGYSQALGGLCDGEGCTQPYMVDMGATGVTLSNGSASLIDINGDALPDLIDTSQEGFHRFFVNVADEDGSSGFMPQETLSAVGTQASHRLGAPGTQILDMNGDGFTDLLNAATGQVLVNKGQRDWESTSSEVSSQNLAAALNDDFDPGEGGLQSLRFIDFNGDKRIDLMRATRAETLFYENRGEQGFEVREGTTQLGAGFEEDNMQLSDMNGDGQLDVVRVQLGGLSYRLNYGWGRWGDWVTINGLPIGEGQIEIAELEDINGDALSDLVVVQADAVTYALNNTSGAFEAPITLTSDGVNGAIPNRGAEVTVLYADMNANGSSDIVWIGPNGQVDYLELFPVRPNLMTRIENNIGQVTDITYTTVAQEMARDGGAGSWRYRLPSPMNVVKSKDEYDLLTDLHTVTEYSYRDGFYDGVEKQFRGFERVETRLLGDETIEEGFTQEVYDVGAEDTYFNGLLVSSVSFSAARELSETRNTYDDCPVAELEEGTELPIRHICKTAVDVIIKEGQEDERWVRTRSESEYDGYGNVTLQSERGVISIGGGGCAPCDGRDPDEFGAPCGAQCVGDEVFTRTEFVSTNNTNGRWIIGAPFRVQTYGREGSELVTEELTWYDGPAFEGLPLGQLDQARVTRTTTRISPDSDEVIETSRVMHDQHGNVIESLDPLGEPGGTTHRRLITYDAEGLRPVRVEVLLEDAEGAPYRLRRDMLYEPLFDKPSEFTDFLRVVDGAVVSLPRSTVIEYDEFSRQRARFLPGNSSDAPDQVYEFDLQSPVSRIISRRRSEAGGPLDQVSIQCLDGRGRDVQSRTRLGEGRYQVTGLTRYNARSEKVEVFQPYIDDDEACDTTPPEGVLSVTYRYDALYRPIERVLPDASIYGAASVSRTTYEPLTTLTFDAEDSDPSGPHADTPARTRTNGAGQTIAIERLLEAGGEPSVVAVHYDSLGRVTGYTDPHGNRKEQIYDLPGRVVRIIDPNSADATTFEYDDASNLVRQTDDRGVVTIHAYDGANRKTAAWDEADPSGTRIAWTYDFDPDCDLCTFTEGVVASASYPGPGDERVVDLYGFDVRSRPSYMGRVMSGVTFETHPTFDNADRSIAVTHPSGQTIHWSYDDADRPTSIEGFIHTMTYDDRSLLESVECGDGSATAMTYDDVMRLDSMTTRNDSGVLQGLSYQRDRMNNILQIDDLADPAPGRPSFAVTHSFDAWYRVTALDFAEETLSIGFNAIENITSVTSSLGDASPAHVGALRYDSFAPNAVTDAGDVMLDYDAAGNVERRGAQAYTWDFMNRLTSASEGEEAIARFVYGDSQSRVARLEGDSVTLYVSPAFEVRDGISTLYIKSGRHRVARIESDELATALLDDANDDGHIGAADAIGQEAPGPVLWSSVRRLLMETGPDDGVTFLHHDHLGNLTLATGLVDGQQQVLGHRSFNPLGTERADGSGYVDEYGFTGQELDRSTGLLHFDWRYLDPRTGRWLSIDPAFTTTTADTLSQVSDATGAYAYVGGGFTNLFDETGLCPGCTTGDSGGGDSGGGAPRKQARKQRTAGEIASDKARMQKIAVMKKDHKSASAQTASFAASIVFKGKNPVKSIQKIKLAHQIEKLSSPGVYVGKYGDPTAKSKGVDKAARKTGHWLSEKAGSPYSKKAWQKRQKHEKTLQAAVQDVSSIFRSMAAERKPIAQPIDVGEDSVSSSSDSERDIPMMYTE